MNKKNLEKVKNRIAQLEREMESNLAKMKALNETNKIIGGGITELRLVVENLTPEKKEKKK